MPQNNDFFQSFYCLGELIKRSISELSDQQSKNMKIDALTTGNFHVLELRIK